MERARQTASHLTAVRAGCARFVIERLNYDPASGPFPTSAQQPCFNDGCNLYATLDTLGGAQLHEQDGQPITYCPAFPEGTTPAEFESASEEAYWG